MGNQFYRMIYKDTVIKRKSVIIVYASMLMKDRIDYI